MKQKIFPNFIKGSLTVLISILVIFTVVKAGTITPPSGAPVATLYTLTNIYNRLVNSTTATEGDHSFTFSDALSGTHYTLKQIYEAIPTINPSKLLSDTTYLGVTGSIANGDNVTGADGPISFSIPDGYYFSKTCTAQDSDLTAGNIKSGVTILGQLGTFKNLLPTTAQVLCYDTDGAAIACGGTDWPDQDADISGDPAACVPTYTQGTYTVIDSCTNLEWQRYGHGSNNGYTAPAAAGDCTNGTYSASYCTYTWQNALKYCSNLTLNSSSDWRLPNIKELQSIINYSIYSPAIDAKFTNTKSDSYWSSTSGASLTSGAWLAYFVTGSVYYDGKTRDSYVRCVRQY